MGITEILSCIGGIGLFLFGMTYMGEALKKCAGNQMKNVLTKITANPGKGFLVGLVVTMVIQSSTATNVMVLSFVNSGMMALGSAVPLVIGSSLGTTITAWLLSLSSINGAGLIFTLLKPASFTPVLCIIGVILYRFIAKGRKADIGAIIIGFAVLMYGMQTMSGAMSGLSSLPGFTDLFNALSNPILGLLFGMAMAAIMQSSSASVGVIQAFSIASGITFSSVIPIIMGINIGQVVPVMIAATGTSKDARRLALIDLFLNAFGAMVWLPVYIILRTTGNFPFDDVVAAPITIAIMHSGYKLLTVIIELPLRNVFLKISKVMIKEVKNPKESLLDERFMSTPALALAQCRQRVGEAIKTSNDSYDETVALMDEWNPDVAKRVHRAEELVDWYQDEIDLYLAKLSTRSMTEKESMELSYLMHVIADYENITDHIYHMVVTLSRLWESGNNFSEYAMKELHEINDLTRRVLKLSEECFYSPDSKKAFKIISLEQRIVKLCEKARDEHMKRLIAGSCAVTEGSVFTDLLLAYERISDHLSKQARQSLFDSYKKQGTGARRFLSMLVDQDPDEEMKLRRGAEK
ncbi:MAG: Na/Pi cotransporter family protein [Candidatus Alectryocaccobium sp.]|jgi:phosphate:Na+ symporter